MKSQGQRTQSKEVIASTKKKNWKRILCIYKFYVNLALFSNKLKHEKITYFVENETILQKDKLIADIFNNYFCNIVKNLSIPKDPSFEDRDKFMWRQGKSSHHKIQRSSKHSLSQNIILNNK